MTKIIAKQIAAIVAESRIEFYLLQQLLHSITPPSATVSQFWQLQICARSKIYNIIQTFAIQETKDCLASVTSSFHVIAT